MALAVAVDSVMGTGKSKARTYNPSANKSKSQGKAAITFADVAGR